MKKINLLLTALLFSAVVLAQNVAITDDGAYTADPSAVLDVKSTDKGMLIPRIDFNEKPSAPATGLLVYVTANGPEGNNAFYYFNGSQWVKIASQASETDPVYTAWDKDYADLTNKPTAISNFTLDANSQKITNIANPTNPQDAATKDYVDQSVTLGLVSKTPSIVVSATDVVLSGLQTVDGVTLLADDRVLLVGQTDPVENGLWLVNSGAWSRPIDFYTGSNEGQAYVLITSGDLNAGSSWLCSTPHAIIDSDPIYFVQFSLPGQTTAVNVGTGEGKIFRDKTGLALNLKTIAGGAHTVVTNNATEVTLASDATSSNIPNTIVARDASGNFAAGIITASFIGNVTGNLSGNASTATIAGNALNFSGSLLGDVNGSQSTTVVSIVGGQTAANIASATVMANSATNANTPNTLVRRDASGNFAAGTITANTIGNHTGNVSGNATTATTATTAVNFSGSLAGDVYGTQSTTVVSSVGGQTAANVASATVMANSATNANIPNTLVRRDGSGNFAAGTITASLNGNATTSQALSGQYIDWDATSGGASIANKPSLDGSETKVTAGTNVNVTGSGTSASPYVVNATAGATNTVANKTGNYTLAATDALVVSASGANSFTLASAASAGAGKIVVMYSKVSPFSVVRPSGNSLWDGSGSDVPTIGGLYIVTLMSDGVSSWYWVN